jgi:ACT domain-containing protein
MSGKEESRPAKKELVVVTSIGIDRPGIVAAITGVLAEANVNIEDISQTIMDKYFTMILLADISKSSLKLEELQKKLEKKTEGMGQNLRVQHENVFKAMNRI